MLCFSFSNSQVKFSLLKSSLVNCTVKPWSEQKVGFKRFRAEHKPNLNFLELILGLYFCNEYSKLFECESSISSQANGCVLKIIAAFFFSLQFCHTCKSYAVTDKAFVATWSVCLVLDW